MKVQSFFQRKSANKSLNSSHLKMMLLINFKTWNHSSRFHVWFISRFFYRCDFLQNGAFYFLPNKKNIKIEMNFSFIFICTFSLFFHCSLSNLHAIKPFIQSSVKKAHGPIWSKFNFYNRRELELTEFFRKLNIAVLEKIWDEEEVKRKLQIERGNGIYRERLVSRIQSSVLRDFITLRY